MPIDPSRAYTCFFNVTQMALRLGKNGGGAMVKDSRLTKRTAYELVQDI